jgi:hypothetical protein
MIGVGQGTNLGRHGNVRGALTTINTDDHINEGCITDEHVRVKVEDE